MKYAASFRDEITRIPKHKQSKREGVDSNRVKKKGTGRGPSESSTLPPITSSCSDITAAVANGNPHSTMSTPFLGPNVHKDETGSPLSKKEGPKSRVPNGNAQGLTRSQEFTRLSPIASSEKRSKGEQLKADSRLISLTPRGSMPRIVKKSSHEINHRTEKVRLKGPLKALKSRAPEEPFSVRRKIEQYRKWHEEQYTEKLKKFKQDVEKFGAENNKTIENPSVEIDLSRIFENASKSSCDRKVSERNSKNDVKSNSPDYSSVGRRKQKRLKTAATWKTWRGVNQSDAYDDVNKYIEDNELMTPEKESWIRNWVFEVERAMFSTDDSNSDVDESGFI